MSAREANPPEDPQTANEHAHAFADVVQDVGGVGHAHVHRGTFTGVSRAVVSVSAEMDEERVAGLATDHGAVDIETDPVLKRVTFTFRDPGGK